MSKSDAREQPGAREETAPSEHEAHAGDEALERLLEQVESPKAAPATSAKAGMASEAPPALRTARVVAMKEGSVQIAWRGRSAAMEASLAEGVDRELVARAMRQGDAVLVEADPELGPLIVGVVQTRLPETLELKANKIVIEGESEVLLRSGTAAVRLREDGDVEMVGSRILSMSRGLYRIVGRVLRLN
jgi:hypothetical protein